MKKKTPDELADLLNERYGDNPIGNDFPLVLTAVVLAGGYKELDEVIAVKKEVVAILKTIRVGRAS